MSGSTLVSPGSVTMAMCLRRDFVTYKTGPGKVRPLADSVSPSRTILQSRRTSPIEGFHGKVFPVVISRLSELSSENRPEART